MDTPTLIGDYHTFPNSVHAPPQPCLEASSSRHCAGLTAMVSRRATSRPRRKVVCCGRPVARLLAPKLVHIQAPVACLAAVLVLLGNAQGLHRLPATCPKMQGRRKSAVFNLMDNLNHESGAISALLPWLRLSQILVQPSLLSWALLTSDIIKGQGDLVQASLVMPISLVRIVKGYLKYYSSFDI